MRSPHSGPPRPTSPPTSSKVVPSSPKPFETRPFLPSRPEGPAGGLSSIDEALADPTPAQKVAKRLPVPEPALTEQAFENVSSEFRRTSLSDLADSGGSSAGVPAPAASSPPVARDPMRELADSVGRDWAPWENEPEPRKRIWPAFGELSGPLRALGILVLAPLFVGVYLVVQQCYGDTSRDPGETPALWPPERMTLVDSRVILETPGRSLWDLVQDDTGPEVELLVTTPVGQAVRRLVSFDAEAVVGGTVVTLEGDGTFGPVSTVHLRLDRGGPREVLKISGIVEPPNDTEIDVSTPEVARLRFGYHLRRQYNELQVVADLTGPDVRLVKVTVERRALILRFERRPEG